MLSTELGSQTKKEMDRILYGINPVKKMIESLLITTNVVLIRPEFEIDVREILEKNYSTKVIKEFNFISVKSLKDLLAQLWQAQQQGYKAWIFRYINSIPDIPDRETIEEIIRIGLKSEDFPFSDGDIHFEEIRILATCSEYPDYLKYKSTGAVVIDLPHEIEETLKEKVKS